MEKVKVEKYFKRIGLDMPETIVPDAALLSKLHYAHCTHVPYENLDILRGILPLRLDDEGLYQKVVEEGKGGYCFELNGLFAWLLRELGYKVTEYASRYLRGESSIPMRRHRVLKVEAIDGVFCADVGIGDVCPRWPVKLEEGLEQPQKNELYRFDKDEFLGWVLMDKNKGEWKPFYSFTEEPQLPQDYVALSCYCERHPDSPFIIEEMFSLKTDTGLIALDGHIYKELVNGKVTVRTLTDEEMPEAYAKFGLKY